MNRLQRASQRSSLVQRIIFVAVLTILIILLIYTFPSYNPLNSDSDTTLNVPVTPVQQIPKTPKLVIIDEKDTKAKEPTKKPQTQQPQQPTKKPSVPPPKPTILIIGAGNIGYATLETIIQEHISGKNIRVSPEKIIVLDIERNDREWNRINSLAKDQKSATIPSTEFIQGDIRDASLMKKIFSTNKINGIIFLAAVSRVIWCVQDTTVCTDVNTNAVGTVLENMREVALSKKNPDDYMADWIVFASSREVYGGVKPENFPVDENTPHLPLNIYGTTKADAEKIIKNFETTLEKPFHKVILRFANVYGSKNDHVDRLIPAIVQKCLTNQPIILSGARQELDFTFIDDVVSSVLLSAKHLIEKSNEESLMEDYLNDFNVVSGEITGVWQLVDMVKQLTLSKSPVSLLPADATYPDKYAAKPDKAQKILGLKAQFNIREGLKSYIKSQYQYARYFLKDKYDRECGSTFQAAMEPKNANQCSVLLLKDATVFNPTTQKFENFSQFSTMEQLQSMIFKISTKSDKILLKGKEGREFELRWDTETKKIAVIGEKNKILDNQGKFTDWDSNTYNLNLHVVCCDNKEESNWPLASYSPLLLRNTFVESSETYCKRLKSSIQYLSHSINRVELPTKPSSNKVKLSEQNSFEIWSLKSQPVCENDCQIPLVCVHDGQCRCIRDEYCGQYKTNPVPMINANQNRNSILSPLGKALGKKHPKIAMLPIDADDSAVQKNCEGKSSTGCNNEDAILYETLQSIAKSSAEEANLMLVPTYHACSRKESDNTSYMKFIAETVKSQQFEGKFFTVMNDEGGACNAQTNNYYQWDNKQISLLDKAIVGQLFGNYKSNCYKPHKDIVIPAKSCRQEELIEKFEKNWKPVEDRTNLVYFANRNQNSGGQFLWSHSLSTCPNVLQTKSDDENEDYLQQFGDSKFCVLLSGTTQLSQRITEAIYAGCIPVFVGEYTHQPFSELIDYSKFSLRVDTSSMHQISSIVKNISEEKRKSLQANLMFARDLFIYKPMQQNIVEWTPQDFVLRYLMVRLNTYYQMSL